MKMIEEKGVTLMTLVITIIVILILISISTTTGISTINLAKFTQFKNELEMLQIKVNELNQSDKLDIGTQDFQKDILNEKVILDIIYKNVLNDEEKAKIREGFRYCTALNISDKLGLDSIKRDYLINIEYRFIICYEGFEYDGVTYYMIDQIDGGMYNVYHNDKSEKNDDNINDDEIGFDDDVIKESDRWRVEISNVKYDYINNWQVQYRLETESYWKNANDLTFYITQSGNYYVKLVHSERTLGPKRVELIE